MTLQDIEASAMDTAKGIKEYVCRKAPHDIPAIIEGYRGDDLVAIAIPDRHDRDLILRVFGGLSMALDLDALALSFDSYTTKMDFDLQTADLQDPTILAALERATTNPLTGKAWGPGEMGEAARSHGGIEKGWMTEAISVSCANRAGDLTMASMTYRYAGRHLVWDRIQHHPQGYEQVGVIVEAMILSMTRPSVSVLLPYQHSDQTRAERDVAAVSALQTALPCQVALVSDVAAKDRVRALRQAGIQFHGQ